MATLESIYRLLDEANERLNQAAIQIRDLPLDPKSDHIHRMGKALLEIFEIQYHLFALQPELTPQIFNGPFEHPEGALNIALRHARTAEEKGNVEVAIAILRLVSSRIGKEQGHRAQAEIARLEGKPER